MSTGVFRRPWRPVPRRVLPTAVVSTDVSAPIAPVRPRPRARPAWVPPVRRDVSVLPAPGPIPLTVHRRAYAWWVSRPKPVPVRARARALPTVPPVTLLPALLLRPRQIPMWIFRTVLFRPAVRRAQRRFPVSLPTPPPSGVKGPSININLRLPVLDAVLAQPSLNAALRVPSLNVNLRVPTLSSKVST